MRKPSCTHTLASAGDVGITWREVASQVPAPWQPSSLSQHHLAASAWSPLRARSTRFRGHFQPLSHFFITRDKCSHKISDIWGPRQEELFFKKKKKKDLGMCKNPMSKISFLYWNSPFSKSCLNASFKVLCQLIRFGVFPLLRVDQNKAGRNRHQRLKGYSTKSGLVQTKSFPLESQMDMRISNIAFCFRQWRNNLTKSPWVA